MGGKPSSLLNGKHVNSSSPVQSPCALPTAQRASVSSGRHNDTSPAVSSTLNQSQQTLVLTQSERKLVKQSWTRIQNPSSPTGSRADNSVSSGGPMSVVASSQRLDELGVLVFLRIFEISPETRNVFPQFRKLDNSTLASNVVFRCHARRFIRSVESVLNDFDSLDLIVLPNLQRLGQRHRDFPGFEPHYLRAFETAMDEIWMKELGCCNYGPSTRIAWNKVFRLITSTIHEGYGGVDGHNSTSTTVPLLQQCPEDVEDSSKDSLDDLACPRRPDANHL